MAKTIISIENLSKKYKIGLPPTTLGRRLLNFIKRVTPQDEFWALKDINLKIKEGETLGFIGPNGAGKTTLLKILARITAPTTGQIIIKGRVSSLLEVGTGFHPELTGRENIFLNGSILGMRRWEIRKKFEAIIDFAEIGRFLDTPVKHYSSGMYVRLAFAIAAHLEPEILILDEVLAVGDAGFQKKCLDKMSAIGKSGRTVLFVSHSMASIISLCPKAVFLKDGRINFYGLSRDCVAKYLLRPEIKRGQASWSDPAAAPGRERIRLKSVSIVDTNDKITPIVPIDRDFKVEIVYWNYQENVELINMLSLRDKFSQIVFTTANIDGANLGKDNWFGKKRKKGIYKTICQIPANFLNEGHYSLDVGVLNGFGEYEINISEVIEFDVVDTGSIRKVYIKDWAGVIRMRFAWRTDLIS